MFDLENSILEWRKQMLAAGIKSPVPLEELEIHLREEIERQSQSGSRLEQAFQIAVQEIGDGNVLMNEFSKAGSTSESLWRKTILTAATVNIMLGAFWLFTGLHALHVMWQTLRLHAIWDPGDRLFLGYHWTMDLYGAVCGATAIVAAIRLFRRRRSGITLTLACSALTILAILVNFSWLVSQWGLSGRLIFGLCLLLLYPVVLFVLCQNSEWKKQYV